ncbi:hypothetical protein [uncultured Endozoicomonas sp.]|uniref:hypothetical protein n=1 Tax=uncultured Endozoicomonas sp. TaxID=432652 RepID=UPI00262E97C3|nr:hypothetical protein [uncultured Endozoicomonas sp.]
MTQRIPPSDGQVRKQIEKYEQLNDEKASTPSKPQGRVQQVAPESHLKEGRAVADKATVEETPVLDRKIKARVDKSDPDSKAGHKGKRSKKSRHHKSRKSTSAEDKQSVKHAHKAKRREKDEFQIPKTKDEILSRMKELDRLEQLAQAKESTDQAPSPQMNDEVGKKEVLYKEMLAMGRRQQKNKPEISDSRRLHNAFMDNLRKSNVKLDKVSELVKSNEVSFEDVNQLHQAVDDINTENIKILGELESQTKSLSRGSHEPMKAMLEQEKNDVDQELRENHEKMLEVTKRLRFIEHNLLKEKKSPMDGAGGKKSVDPSKESIAQLAGIMRQKKHEIVQENRQKYEKALKITEQLSLKGGIAVAGRNSLVKQLRAVIESIASNDEVAVSVLADLKELEQNGRVLSIYSGYIRDEWIKIPFTKAEARDREDAMNDFTAVMKEVSVENDEVISRIKAKLTNL